MQQARQTVSQEFEAVNQLIIAQLHSNVPMVENIGHYIVDAGGKRLRPLIALLAAGACGELGKANITLAAVIEFIHTATLLHDDVVDISSLRRGRPTANAEWGNAPSVLVGDFLYTRAFQLLVELGDMEVMRVLSRATNTIAEGEVLQLTKAGDPHTSSEDYFQVIENKTAVLFAAATSCSAILSKAPEQHIDHLYQYGLHLGLAFQLVDDALDYQGSAEEMGKNVGDDLAEGKPTLPLIYTIQNGTSSQRQLIEEAISNKDNSKIDQVINAVSSSGALDHTRSTAEKHSQKAALALTGLSETPYKNALLKIAALSTGRRS